MSKIKQLSQCLVEKYNLSQHDADTFVAEMFSIIRENLAYDGIVKVKGLGTFKLAEMNARESVNVNTGERITIEGRNKISFTPENSVRDRINAPFSAFESIDLAEDIDFSLIDQKYDEELAEPE
ncbi:MAG: HU family DNA-binding protein, partial [Prevotellaceae bacterium]|nr:HU family DNA-binding protein [Prevotellaceae bacterium]